MATTDFEPTTLNGLDPIRLEVGHMRRWDQGSNEISTAPSLTIFERTQTTSGSYKWVALVKNLSFTDTDQTYADLLRSFADYLESEGTS